MTFEEHQIAMAQAVAKLAKDSWRRYEKETKNERDEKEAIAIAELDFLQEYWERPDDTVDPVILEVGRDLRLTMFWISIFGVQIEEVTDED